MHPEASLDLSDGPLDLTVQTCDVTVTLRPCNRACCRQTRLDLKAGAESCTLDQGPRRAQVGERPSSRWVLTCWVLKGTSRGPGGYGESHSVSSAILVRNLSCTRPCIGRKMWIRNCALTVWKNLRNWDSLGKIRSFDEQKWNGETVVELMGEVRGGHWSRGATRPTAVSLCCLLPWCSVTTLLVCES